MSLLNLRSSSIHGSWTILLIQDSHQRSVVPAATALFIGKNPDFVEVSSQSAGSYFLAS